MRLTDEQANEIHMAAAHNALRAITLSIQHGSVQTGFTIMVATLAEFARHTAEEGRKGDVIQLIADKAVESLLTMPPLLREKK